MSGRETVRHPAPLLCAIYSRIRSAENHIAPGQKQNKIYFRTVLQGKEISACLKYFLIVFLTLSSCLASAHIHGQSLVDSLVAAIPGAAADSNKVKLLDKLSYTYATINPDECIRRGQQTLELARNIHWEKGVTLAMVDLGIGYEARSDHARALSYYQEALARYEQAGDKVGLARVMIFTAFLYVAQSKYSSALSCDFRALNINDSLGNRKASATTMENIGHIYFEQKEYDKAKAYYDRVLQINYDLGDKESIARSHSRTGSLLGAQGNYAGAVKQYEAALKINEELRDTSYIQIRLANIGDAYSQLRDYPNALEYEQRALHISENTENKIAVAVNTGNIGETWLRMYRDTAGQPKPVYLHNAVKYLASAVAMCAAINSSAPLIEFSHYLSDAYALSDNYKKAFESLRQYGLTKDSIFSLQNKSQIKGLEQEREDELSNKEKMIKDKQIRIDKLEISENQYRQKLYTAGISLLVLVIVVVLKSLYDNKKNNKVLTKELKKESDEKLLTYEKLQESEEHYKSLFNLNPSPMWVLDSETLRFLQVNAAAIKNYGYTNEEFLSMTAEDIKTADDVGTLRDVLQANVNHGEPQNIFTRHCRKNKEEFYVEAIFNHIPFKGKTAILTMAEDISLQVDYIKAIEIQNDKLQEIALIQSHKVRSPLCSILGLANLLDFKLPEVELKETVAGIVLSSHKLDEVIKEITENTSVHDVSKKYPDHIKGLFPETYHIPYRSY